VKLTWSKTTIELAVPFRISRWAYESRIQVMVKFQHEQWTGYGEASPNARFEQSPQSCEAALYQMASQMKGDPRAYHLFIENALQNTGRESAARSAFVMAVLDWVGKATNQPIYRILGLSKEGAPTTLSIGIDEPERVAERAREAAENHHVLKLKVDQENVRDIVSAVRKAVMLPLIIDGNESWSCPERCLEDIGWMHQNGVVVLEQPLPADQLEAMSWLKSRSSLKLIADEAFTHAEDLSKLQDCYHGVNIKLAKCGGILEAFYAAREAQKRKLDVMLGCMVESGLAIAAAASLASLATYVDLDGNLLLKEDPFHGLPLVNGVVTLRDAPGLGVWPL
jgi:L-alanine-DL-glutamate epimerase-like enolase superfamily enzyme